MNEKRRALSRTLRVGSTSGTAGEPIPSAWTTDEIAAALTEGPRGVTATLRTSLPGTRTATTSVRLYRRAQGYAIDQRLIHCDRADREAAEVLTAWETGKGTADATDRRSATHAAHMTVREIAMHDDASGRRTLRRWIRQAEEWVRHGAANSAGRKR